MKSAFLFLSLFLLGSRIFGQTLVITDSASTSSICFNDGTIQVAATGGSGVYTFYIVAGPSYPNITYPMTLQHQDSVFLTLPHGQYTIMVVDGARDTAYATSTVAGSYTFPVISPLPPAVVDSSCIVVNAVGGRPPYQFAISTQGTNIGFGPYQSSNSFCHLCDGTYWIRVKDSCSNIFTTNRVNVSVPVPQYLINSQTYGNVDSIHITVTTAGAVPYTFHLQSGSISLTNHTGTFGIPVRCPQDTISITDSCGRVYSTILNLHPLSVNVQSPCNSGSAFMTIDSAAIAPFTITGSNGSLVTHLHQLTFTGLSTTGPLTFAIRDSCGNLVNIQVICTQDTNPFFTVCPFDSSIHMTPSLLRLCYPAIVTCLNCSPVQSDTLHTSIPVRLFTNIDTGVTYVFHITDSCGRNDTIRYMPEFVNFQLGDSLISCRDFTVFTNPHVIYTPPVLYSVYDQGIFIDSSSAYQPTFYHLPAGTYQIYASQRLCRQSAVTVTLPGLRGACLVPMFDSNCTRSYAIYQSLATTRETYTLVNTATSAAYVQTIPSPYSNAAVFMGVPVGNYNLVSDSGCSSPFPLPAFSHTITAISTRQCTGQALITVTITPAIHNCNSGQGAYVTLLKDNQYIANQNVNGGTTAQFLVSDTGKYVVHLFYSNTSDFTLDAHYDTICPLDTTVVYVDDNVVPNIVAPQVILVCGNVTGNIPYRIFGGTAPYTVDILGYPSRHVAGTNDTFPNVSVGVYTMIVSDSCGISRSFSVSVINICSNVCTLQSRFSVSDSLACSSGIIYLHNLSTGASSYRWNINGVLYAYGSDTSLYAYGSDTSFVATAGTSYTIKLYAYVGVCTDSFTLTFIDTCHGACVIHSAFSLSDTVTCTHALVSLQNQSIGATTYEWDINGAVYSNAADTSFSTGASGTYIIKLYARSQCSDSAVKIIVVEDSLRSPARIDTSLCTPFTLQLNSHQSNTVWSNATADSVTTVTSPGLYQASISNACGTIIDTVNVIQYPLIAGFSLTDSKAKICEDRPDTVNLLASIDSGQRSVVFIWNTGLRDTSVYQSTVTVYHAGSYDVTADDGHCPEMRTISIADSTCDSSCIKNFVIPTIFSPNGDGVNDTFFLPHTCDISPFAMHIYNKWGELIFECQDINQGWDGKYKGEKQMEGVYWLWLMLTPGNTTIYKSATVTLVR